MKLSGLIIETSPVHSTKSARPLSIVKFVFLCDNAQRVAFRTRDRLLILLWRSALAEQVGLCWRPNSNLRVDSGKFRQIAQVYHTKLTLLPIFPNE